MKIPLIHTALALVSLLLVSSCATGRDDGPYTGSHTGAKDSADFIENVKIQTTARAAVQFAVLALHEGKPEAATSLKDDLDAILGALSVGPEVRPEALLSQVKRELSAAQQARLAEELAEADRHLSGKLANGSIVDVLQSYTAADCLAWMREAAEWSANGYNFDIVCSHGIALDHHRHNPGTGIRIDLDFNKVDERRRLEVER